MQFYFAHFGERARGWYDFDGEIILKNCSVLRFYYSKLLCSIALEPAYGTKRTHQSIKNVKYAFPEVHSTQTEFSAKEQNMMTS